MSTKEENTRPSAPAPKDKKKEPLGSVIAHGANGQIFEIPAADAGKYKMSADRQKELNYGDNAGGGDEGEVGGRHAVPLRDGTVGYHSDWLYGAYIWWKDLNAYRGYHWHPNRYNPAAYDEDDY